MVKESTLDWNQVTDELAAMPPQRLTRFLQQLEQRRREVALRQGYTALSKLSFEDVPTSDEWLALENQALSLVDMESHAHS